MTPELELSLIIWGALMGILMSMILYAQWDEFSCWLEWRILDAQWSWNRFIKSVKWKVASALPDWLVYLAAIRLISHATTGEYSNTEVPEIRAMTALKRWGKRK